VNNAAWTIAAACCLDAAVGDPPGWPHPVRLMGAAIALGDRHLNRAGAGSRRAGCALAIGVIAAAAVAGRLLDRWPVTRIVLAGSTLAARNLFEEVDAVADALARDDLARARTAVARIVGRDTADLDHAGVARAALETLAESASDGIVAPLWWLAVGGLPAALAFKAASTLDSMIGHREPRYRRFGAFAARTDDALNLIPARVTALLIALASGAPRGVLRRTWDEAPRHASPNAGWPEAALAAAVGVRLGGTNRYDGVPVIGPVFNGAGRSPTAADVRAALGLVRVAVRWAGFAAVAARA
jgi:adenosylcobinamide-phosphate synthase